MNKSVKIFLVLGTLAMALVTSYTNCSSYNENSFTDPSKINCTTSPEACKQGTTTFLNAPSNNTTLGEAFKTVAGQAASGQLQLNGDCYIAGSPLSPHHIDFSITKSSGGTRTTVPGTSVSVKCNHGHYFALINITGVTAAMLQQEQYSVRGELYVGSPGTIVGNFESPIYY